MPLFYAYNTVSIRRRDSVPWRSDARPPKIRFLSHYSGENQNMLPKFQLIR